MYYCSELGMGVYKLYREGKTGCMVFVDAEGNVKPLYLKDLQDPVTAGCTNPAQAASLADFVVLPLPVTTDASTLNAPFSRVPVPFPPVR